MIARRLDLGLLRHVLVAVALTLGLAVAATGGASASPNTGQTPAKTKGQMTCEWAGGTWTVVVEGVKATCTGLGKDRDYSCNLKVGPSGTACSHLTRRLGGSSSSTDRSSAPASTLLAAPGAAAAATPLDR